MNLLLVTEVSDSKYKSVVELLFEIFDEEGEFLPFFSISPDFQPEGVLCLLFLDFSFCLSTFLSEKVYAPFALPTTFAASSSVESPALPLSFRLGSLSEFTTGEDKVWLVLISFLQIMI